MWCASESGEEATGAPLWPLPALLYWPLCWSASRRCHLLSANCILGRPPSCPVFTQTPISLPTEALFLQKRGLPCSLYSHNALQDSGEEGLRGLDWAGWSLVGLLLSDRTVRQGWTQADREGGEGEKEKRGRGSRKGDCATAVTVTRALPCCGHWGGHGKGRKDNSSWWAEGTSPAPLGPLRGRGGTAPLGPPGRLLIQAMGAGTGSLCSPCAPSL